MKVYVDRRRHKVLSALKWPEEDVAMLTTNPAETIIWVAPLGHINMKNMPQYQNIRKRGFSRDFDKVVGFRPTGCAYPIFKSCDFNSFVLLQGPCRRKEAKRSSWVQRRRTVSLYTLYPIPSTRVSPSWWNALNASIQEKLSLQLVLQQEKNK